MTFALPPIDAHAHVKVAIDARALNQLGALVFAVTGERAEWGRALERDDGMTLWGIGCHPGATAEIENFSSDSFRSALSRAQVIGEVGLDGRSSAPMPLQQQVFREILSAALDEPRPITIHSRFASGPVLDELEGLPQPGAILHWWRGSEAQTMRAIELGCFFSLNGAEAKNPKVLSIIPPDRVLTETDFPHSRRTDPRADRPAAVETIEKALANEWHLDLWGVRQQLWRNLQGLFTATKRSSSLPPPLQRKLLSVPA